MSVWQAALAAQRVTKTIPIVFVIVPDPVRLGFADSLARPGRNLTGMSNMMADLIAKRFEMLRDAIEGVSRVALIVNATDPDMADDALEESRRAATHLSFEIVPVEVRRPADLDGAFSTASEKQVHAVVTAPDPMLYNERDRLAKLAIKHRLPLMTHNVDMGERRCAARLWAQRRRSVSRLHRRSGPHLAGRQSCRDTGSAANAFRAARQSADRKRNGHKDPGSRPATCGSCY